MRGLLDEMVGLGVLSRAQGGLYRLRSPNLVRLMGTEQDIGDRLLNLEKSVVPTQPTATDYHALLDPTSGSYSPLSYDQESRCFAPRTGVTVVFACPAQGLAALAPAYARLAPEETRTTTTGFTSVPSSVSNAADMQRFLDEFVRSHPRFERLLVHCSPLGLTGAQLAGLTNAALQACRDFEQRQRHSIQQWLRILIVLDASSTWAWLSLPGDVRHEIENQVYPDWPRPWTGIGIRHRLHQCDMVDSEAVCQALVEVTGGWHMLLDYVFRHSRGRRDDPREVANELYTFLGQPEHEATREFCGALGHTNKLVQSVMAYVVREGETLREFLSPDLFPDLSSVTAEDCDRAVEFLLRTGSLQMRDGVLMPDAVVARALHGA
jgi:hypothetical protein